MNLYSNFQYLQDHSKVNAEYLKRVELLQSQVEQLKQYHNPEKRFTVLRLLNTYESFLDSIYLKLSQKGFNHG